MGEPRAIEPLAPAELTAAARQRIAALHPDVERFYRTAARIALAIAARTQQMDGAEAAGSGTTEEGQP